MKEIVTDRYIIKVVDFQDCVDVTCPERCFAAENGIPSEKCSYKEMRDIVSDNKLKIAITKLLIKNISSELINFKYDRFDMVDSLGFIYKSFNICHDLHKNSRVMKLYYELPPNTQIYFNLYTIAFEKDTQLSKVHYTDGRNCYTIDISGVSDNITTTEEVLRIENYKLSEEFQKTQQERKLFEERDSEESPLHYRTEEDDDCFYVISEEKEKFITFSRKFNLNKSNYNWVNKGEPLISLYFDEDNSLKFAECDLDSPVTGIFEFDKKRFIAYGEIICKIRKYSKKEKAEVFRELEKDTIKENLLKREQKKKLEREALDELIAEGLIFNTYIDRMGNRDRIPNEVANAVWNRDGGKCCYCGSKENLEFDHIIPVSKGGATTFRNMQLLCKPCNIKKANKIG